jgi:hypothetical protein
MNQRCKFNVKFFKYGQKSLGQIMMRKDLYPKMNLCLEFEPNYKDIYPENNYFSRDCVK